MDTNSGEPAQGPASRPSTCPVCGSAVVKQIAFGLPSAELFDDLTVMLAGCVLPPGPSPDWACGSCHHEWPHGRRMSVDNDAAS